MVTEEFDMIPECFCGGGRMKLLCVGPEATHVGRYFYKCPTDAKHFESFLLCDDYHSTHGDGKQPAYVKRQSYRPNKQMWASEAVKKKASRPVVIVGFAAAVVWKLG